MSSRARKAQRVSQHDPSDPSSNHARSRSSNEEYSKQRSTGDDSDVLIDGESNGPYQDFSAVGVGELLDFDPRPTIVIHEDFDQDLEPVFLNRSIRLNDQLMKTIPFKLGPNSPQLPSKVSSVDFVAWVKDVAQLAGAKASTISYCGFVWTGFIVRKRWIIISGDRPIQDSGRISLPLRSDSPVSLMSGQRTEIYKETQNPPPQRTLTSSQFGSPTEHKGPSFITPGTPDWTLTHPEGDLSPHVIFARSIDWGSTPLGDMNTWSKEFRQISNHLMANPHPAALFWGEELTVMYNKAYADGVAGNKHPQLMGTGFRGPFSELWDLVSSIFNECRKTGKSVAVEDQMLPIERHGFLEETFYSWSLTPLYGGTSQILGLYNAPFETTRQTRSARALRTLLRLGQETALANSVSTFWPQILKALEDNEFDFPFALLYSVADDIENDTDDASSMSHSSESSLITKSCLLEGSLGVPDDHPAAPKRLDLKRSRGGFIPSFREAMKTREPKLLNFTDGSIPESLIEGIEWRGFHEPCREAVVCPIRPTTGENVMGFLFVGINPRRPFDEDYQSFIQLIDRQLATSLASVSLLEAEVRRGLTAAEAAALERSRLSEELAVQRSRLQRIAEVSPVGMFSIDPTGMLLEANDRWFEITDHPRNTIYPMSWMETLSENSRRLMEKGWQRLTVDQMPWSAELQLKKTWYDSSTGEEVEYWMLAAAQPEFADGELRTIMGSITDITLQKRSAKDAETRAKLSEQLLLRTQEAKENEKNFKRFSDLAPGGLVIMTSSGKIEYANSQWYKISGHPQGSEASAVPLSWTNAILEDDQTYFASKWDELVTQKRTVTIEARMQTPWEGEIGGSIIKTQRWILASVYPEVSEDGVLRTVMGCITDISSIKWAEGLQNRRLKEAEETRRAQNNFIDITSHEMRNPLSAIIQCADGISTSLKGLISKSRPLDQELTDAVKESISSAETIQLCAQHQKSIVDDILTISKLDSNLLLITPIPIQPVIVVQQALQMFVVECQKVHDINLEFHIDKSFHDLNVDIVMLDSSRLLQVLINLMTNAIKFTKTSATRTINVSIGAYLQPPSKESSEFDYFPTKKARSLSDITAGSEWGNGQILYLRFEVRDSGCGLTPDEKKKLFNRFAQASPRTHVQYGGSGLGLFISRQLTELQGGEIGVASEAGVGSTFAFYVKARRSETVQSPGAMLTRLNSDLQSNARLATNVPKSLKDHEVSTLQQLTDAASGLVPQTSLADSKLSNWHVLIVEDNLVNQRILAQQMRKLGCIVHVANHGQEALDLIMETRAYKGIETDGKELSIILMDLEMPVMDGLTCVRKIREMEAEGLIHGRLPIIAVTANARGEQIAAAKDSGMDDVMPKPFRIRQLVPKIEMLLQNTTRQ